MRGVIWSQFGICQWFSLSWFLWEYDMWIPPNLLALGFPFQFNVFWNDGDLISFGNLMGGSDVDFQWILIDFYGVSGGFFLPSFAGITDRIHRISSLYRIRSFIRFDGDGCAPPSESPYDVLRSGHLIWLFLCIGSPGFRGVIQSNHERSGDGFGIAIQFVSLRDQDLMTDLSHSRLIFALLYKASLVRVCFSLVISFSISRLFCGLMGSRV